MTAVSEKYVLVVFDDYSKNGENGEPEGVIIPYLKDYHLYTTHTGDKVKFLWVHISGDAKVPEAIALRPGWRPAREGETSLPIEVSYYAT